MNLVDFHATHARSGEPPLPPRDAARPSGSRHEASRFARPVKFRENRFSLSGPAGQLDLASCLPRAHARVGLQKRSLCMPRFGKLTANSGGLREEPQRGVTRSELATDAACPEPFSAQQK